MAGLARLATGPVLAAAAVAMAPSTASAGLPATLIGDPIGFVTAGAENDLGKTFGLIPPSSAPGTYFPNGPVAVPTGTVAAPAPATVAAPRAVKARHHKRRAHSKRR